MYPEEVMDPAHTKTFAKKGKFCLRVLTWLNTHVHGSDDIDFRQEWTCDAAPWPHCDSECGVAVYLCVDGGQSFSQEECCPDLRRSG